MDSPPRQRGAAPQCHQHTDLCKFTPSNPPLPHPKPTPTTHRLSNHPSPSSFRRPPPHRGILPQLILRPFLYLPAVLLLLLSRVATPSFVATSAVTRRTLAPASAFVFAPHRRRYSPSRSYRPFTTSITTSTTPPLYLEEDSTPRRPFDIELLFTMAAPSSSDNIIDGKAIAEVIRGEIKEECSALMASSGVKPGLAVVLVGNRTDSATYVRMKIKACEEVGINSFKFEFPEDVTEADLIAKVEALNADPAVHGILVQLPIPPHIHEQKVLDTILPDKDVDGLHPLNLAKLAHTNTHGAKGKFDLKTLPFHAACTPQGCIELIERSGMVIEGKEAVVIGRSNIVGIPVSLLLMQKNATVTIVHSRTKNVEAVCKRADIIVAAVGRAEMVKADFVKPGAVVIDVGINSVDDPTSKKGYKLVGDVDFEACKAVAGKITPVPGGVGPMTIAMLLRNTLQGARRAAAGGREDGH